MGSKAQMHASRARAYLAAGNAPKARAHLRRAYQLFGEPRRIQSAADGTDAYEAAAAVEAAEAVEAVVLVNDPSNAEQCGMRLIAREYAAVRVDMGEIGALMDRALKAKIGRGAPTRIRHNMRLFFAPRTPTDESLTGHPYGPLFLLFRRTEQPRLADWHRDHEAVTSRPARGRECNMAERVVDLPCYYGPKEAEVHANIHFALLDDVVLELRANVADVEEVWLQLPTRGESALSPFLVVVNRELEYEYVFGETRPVDEEPPSYATSGRLRGEPAMRGGQYRYYDDDGGVVAGAEERRLRRARLGSEGPLALTRLVLALLSRYYRPELGRSRYEASGALEMPASVEKLARDKLRLSVASVVSARDVARHWKSIAYAPGGGLMSGLKRHFEETSERAGSNETGA